MHHGRIASRPGALVRATCLALALGVVAGVVPGTPTVAARAAVAGDVNCDGTLDGSDLPALIAGLFDGSQVCAAADLNGDERLSAPDVTGLWEILIAAGPSPSPTPSRTLTSTKTPTKSPSSTATTTPTATKSGTVKPTATPTRTPSATRTQTLVPTPTATRTLTKSPTATSTRTLTPTLTFTKTRVSTWTPSPTSTPTQTRTRTFTRTPTTTPTKTGTPTITPTRTVTRTPTVTPSLPMGPVVTYFGLTTADNHVVPPTDTTVDGVPIFDRPNAFGFIVVVEGRPGASKKSVGTFGTMESPSSGTSRPDIQIEAGRSLGNGSAAVCDTGPLPAPLGGVPGTNPFDFSGAQSVTDALNDLACRFDSHLTSLTACTLDALDNYSFVVKNTTVQFCSVPSIGAEVRFPSGETELRVQLRDVGGNIGNQASIIVRVP